MIAPQFVMSIGWVSSKHLGISVSVGVKNKKKKVMLFLGKLPGLVGNRGARTRYDICIIVVLANNPQFFP